MSCYSRIRWDSFDAERCYLRRELTSDECEQAEIIVSILEDMYDEMRYEEAICDDTLTIEVDPETYDRLCGRPLGGVQYTFWIGCPSHHEVTFRGHKVLVSRELKHSILMTGTKYLQEETRYMPYKYNIDVRDLEFLTPIRAINVTPTIKKVIFNKPATIVYWSDGTKTVVKCGKNDEWDEEKGLAMAISKKLIGLKEFYKQYNNTTKEKENKK